MKSIKNFLPLLIISAFPFYFESVATSYDWLTESKEAQAFLGIMTIGVIGMLGVFINNEVLK